MTSPLQTEHFTSPNDAANACESSLTAWSPLGYLQDGSFSPTPARPQPDFGVVALIVLAHEIMRLPDEAVDAERVSQLPRHTGFRIDAGAHGGRMPGKAISGIADADADVRRVSGDVREVVRRLQRKSSAVGPARRVGSLQFRTDAVVAIVDAGAQRVCGAVAATQIHGGAAVEVSVSGDCGGGERRQRGDGC